MKLILDTNVLIDFCHNQTRVLTYLKSIDAQALYITMPTYIEFLAGATSKQKVWSRKFLSQFILLDFTEKTTQTAKNLSMKYKLERSKGMDFLIASIAISNNIALSTQNVKDFKFTELQLFKYSIPIFG